MSHTQQNWNMQLFSWIPKKIEREIAKNSNARISIQIWKTKLKKSFDIDKFIKKYAIFNCVTIVARRFVSDVYNFVVFSRNIHLSVLRVSSLFGIERAQRKKYEILIVGSCFFSYESKRVNVHFGFFGARKKFITAHNEMNMGFRFGFLLVVSVPQFVLPAYRVSMHLLQLPLLYMLLTEWRASYYRSCITLHCSVDEFWECWKFWNFLSFTISIFA